MCSVAGRRKHEPSATTESMEKRLPACEEKNEQSALIGVLAQAEEQRVGRSTKSGVGCQCVGGRIGRGETRREETALRLARLFPS